MRDAELEYRMYGLVPYNLSPIQQGIQYGHAVVEYMIGNPPDSDVMDKLGKWMHYDKTFIILNGGTTNLGFQGEGKGSLNKYADELRLKNIKFADFHEPDLGDQLTAVVFLVDERVWNKKKYPNFKFIFRTKEIKDEFISYDIVDTDTDNVKNFLIDKGEYKLLEVYESWEDSIGKENLFLREFLKNFKLA